MALVFRKVVYEDVYTYYAKISVGQYSGDYCAGSGTTNRDNAIAANGRLFRMQASGSSDSEKYVNGNRVNKIISKYDGSGTQSVYIKGYTPFTGCVCMFSEEVNSTKDPTVFDRNWGMLPNDEQVPSDYEDSSQKGTWNVDFTTDEDGFYNKRIYFRRVYVYSQGRRIGSYLVFSN